MKIPFLKFIICILLFGGHNLYAQNYSCITVDSIQSLNFLGSNESRFIIIAEDSHTDNLTNRQFVLDYLIYLNKNGFDQILFEGGASFEYVSTLEDTTLIKELIAFKNYSFLRQIFLYNENNYGFQIAIIGVDVETYPPFALKIMGYILDKYSHLENKELDKLKNKIAKMSLIESEEVDHDSIMLISKTIKLFAVKNARILSEKDAKYLDEISNKMELGILFNYENWGLREEHIYKNIESINNNKSHKSILLIGTQHVDKKIYKNTPSVYKRMIDNSIIEASNTPIVIFNKNENLNTRLRIYNLAKKDFKHITSFLAKHPNGLTYCKNVNPRKYENHFLFYRR